MRILKLSDGTQHEIYRCGAADGYLWIGLSGRDDLLSVGKIFNDSRKTAVMESTYDSEGAHTVRYEGYTRLVQLSVEEQGVLIALQKGE